MATQTQNSQQTQNQPIPTPEANSQNASNTCDGCLKPGVVAGVVVGVAIGVAILAVLATFLTMRQVRRNRGRRGGHGFPEQRSIGKSDGSTEGKQPLTRDVSVGRPALEDFLPQAADDRTVQSKTKTILDQIELFVENFCQAQPSSHAGILSPELSSFGSPSLHGPLPELLKQSQDATPIIKHVLANYIVTAISTGNSPQDTLLPTEFSLFLNRVMTNGTHTTKKAGFVQCLSQWRVLSAFLHPNPSSDPVYTADRDRKIADMSQKVLGAFSAWMKTKYNEPDRVRSLGVILNEVAELGTFLFSQPSEIRFQWPELSTSRLAVTPALVKTTDEYGRKLAQAQVLVSATVVKVK